MSGPRLTEAQLRLLQSARAFARKFPEAAKEGTLVSGREYRTALALEKKGLVTVRHGDAPDEGWVCAEPVDQACDYCGRPWAAWPVERASSKCSPASWANCIRPHPIKSDSTRERMAQAWDEGYLHADEDYNSWLNGERGERFERVLDANPYRVRSLMSDDHQGDT